MIKKIIKILIIFCIILGLLALSPFVAFKLNDYANEHVRLTKYSFVDKNIPKPFDGFKLFVISDLHNAPFADQIIAKIEKTKPDAIALVGDIVQLPDANCDETMKIAKRFKGKIPIYAVSGNHESQNDGYWSIRDSLDWYGGVKWLEDKGITLKKDGKILYFVGISDPGHSDLSQDHMQSISEFISGDIPQENAYSILLCHRSPLYPGLKDTGVGLIVSGHLHGGVARIPFKGGICGEGGKLNFPKYAYGMIKEGNSATMIVSGGCDKNPDKKRYFNPPEVLLITLERE